MKSHHGHRVFPFIPLTVSSHGLNVQRAVLFSKCQVLGAFLITIILGFSRYFKAQEQRRFGGVRMSLLLCRVQTQKVS